MADVSNMFLRKLLKPFSLAPRQSSLYIPQIIFANYSTRLIFFNSPAELPTVSTRQKKQGVISQRKRQEERKENIKMKKVLPLVLLIFITILPGKVFAVVKQKNQLLQATTAALVVQSLQLGEKAQQLFSIKDDLLNIVKLKEGNLTPQEDMMINAASEMKYIATIAYFEGNLLGAVLALKKEFKMPFIDNRILEIDNAIKGTSSSLQPIQVAHSTIEDKSALRKLGRSVEVVGEILEIYRNSIEILQRIKEKEFGKEEIKQPSN